MITRVRLQNWTSFGALQEAPLEAITVLVGANNSGKSNFLRFPQALKGLPPVWVHRPLVTPRDVLVAFDAETGAQRSTWSLAASCDSDGRLSGTAESVSVDGHVVLQNGMLGARAGAWATLVDGVPVGTTDQAVVAPLFAMHPSIRPAAREAIAATIAPILSARSVRLGAEAIRASNQLTPSASINPDGSQLAALIARWSLEMPERLDEYNEILRRCLPEMRRILTRVDGQGSVRLLFEQTDGERFDAPEVSDGVVLFAALIAHALEAPENGLVLIEEPERGIHPRRLADLVDVLRTLVHERNTQFIMASHSPALLNLLRDQPESILLFRRTARGTEIRCLSEVPELAETLTRADPGEMLANGVFNEGFRGEGPNEAVHP